GGLSGGEGLLVTGIGLLAARVEAEGLSGLGLRMLRGIRIACAEVGLTVTGAVRRPLGRIARRLCRIIGSLRFAGRRRGVLLGGSALGRCRIGARLALSILFLRRCVGAGTLTVVRLPEPLVVRLPVCLCAGLLADRLPVLLCAGLFGGGELALLSELIGSGLARPTGLAGSGLDGSTRLARTGWGRAVGSESGCTAGHIGHGGRVRRVLGHRSGLRVALDVFATGEFAGEEGDHGEHAGEEGKQRGEERQV